MVRLGFLETKLERTHEFTLGWSSVHGGPSKEIVRQQWNFSPAGSTREVEEYQTRLEVVVVLELAIQPDLEHGDARATLLKSTAARPCAAPGWHRRSRAEPLLLGLGIANVADNVRPVGDIHWRPTGTQSRL